MAIYKVPQDVEADDKLLGPLSFKQFAFLMVTVMMIGFAYVLFRVLPPLAIIPLPFILLFGALALPLRKDQPMEVYLAALLSFMIKPKKRIWKADGIEELVEVTAPKVEEKVSDKRYDQDEINRRLAYLANLVDSRGWSVRGVDNPNSSMQEDLYHEAINTGDVLDSGGTTAGRIDSLIAQSDTRRREEMMARMRQQTQPTPVMEPQSTYVQPATAEPITSVQPISAISAPQEQPDPTPTFNPYPTMQQSVITPISEQRPLAPVPPTNPPQPILQPAAPPTEASPPAPQPQPEPVQAPISPAIIDLANNHSDLSIETLQREAHRIQQKEREAELSEEVVISLH